MTTLADVRRLGLTPRQVVDLLGELIAKAGASTQFVGGAIGFCVRGADGGTWVLDLSVPGGCFEDDDGEAFERAATRIYTFGRDFAALLLAPDAIVGLLETGRIVVEGDKTKLGRLAKLVRQGAGRSSIAVRARD
ncbi:MAG: hypothetical protein RIT81_27220 [Deltaproteobacteria bacterium]